MARSSKPYTTGRPRSAVRLALALAAADAPGCVRDLAARAGVKLPDAAVTVKNMCRAGELVTVGEARMPWRQAPVQLYAASVAGHIGVHAEQCTDASAASELQALLASAWREK